MENTDSRKHLLQLSITFLIFVIPSFAIELSDTFLFENSQFDFSFDRQRIAEGQWWRLLVGHFDHLSWFHLGLNALFLGVLLFTFSGLGRAVRIVSLLCAFFLIISVMIWFCSPGLSVYVGLSGGLYGLLVYALYQDHLYPLWLRGLVFLGLLVKVVYEYFADASEQVAELIGGSVATDVHVYGVFAGVLSVIFLRIFRI